MITSQIHPRECGIALQGGGQLLRPWGTDAVAAQSNGRHRSVSCKHTRFTQHTAQPTIGKPHIGTNAARDTLESSSAIAAAPSSPMALPFRLMA